MKKILFLINSLAFGGAEKQVVTLFNNLDRKRFDVRLIYFEDKTALLSQIDNELFPNTICFHRTKKFDYEVLRKLRMIISQNKFDSVICTCEYTMFYAYLARLMCKHKFRLTVVIHGTIIFSFYNTIKNILYRKIMNKCDNVLFVCRKQMNYWIEKYKIKPALCEYIYNGIDVDFFTDRYDAKEKIKIRSELGISKEEIVIGICAVLRPEKRHEDLISAAKRLIDEGIKVKVLIIGDGARRSFIEGYIKKMDMEEDAIITGFKEDVRPYMAISDLLAITSHAVETFSIAILEGMAMSKGIIATDIGGASEMLEDGVNGFLYFPGDIDALRSKIKTMIDNDLSTTMGKRSREIVEKKFTSENMVSQYEKLFLS